MNGPPGPRVPLYDTSALRRSGGARPVGRIDTSRRESGRRIPGLRETDPGARGLSCPYGSSVLVPHSKVLGRPAWPFGRTCTNILLASRPAAQNPQGCGHSVRLLCTSCWPRLRMAKRAFGSHVEGASCRSLRLLSRRRIGCRIREHLQRLLPSQFLAGNRDWVLARQATEAHVVPRMLQGRDEAAEGEVAEAVRIDEVRDLGDRLLVRYELIPRLHVDPEVAGEADRRAPDSDMDFAGAREAQDLDDLPDRRPADDRVVDQDDSLVLDRGTDRIQLEHDPDLPVLLVRHDERPLDVAILDEPLDHREPGRLRVALCLGPTRFRGRHADVRRDRIFPGKLFSDLHAGIVPETIVE